MRDRLLCVRQARGNGPSHARHNNAINIRFRLFLYLNDFFIRQQAFDIATQYPSPWATSPNPSQVKLMQPRQTARNW
ncbi:hypothetical protein Gaha_0341_002 [Novacetimonas hansenii JCM 7643]|nr:hypothetical protein Gaha_0341_002 [Novacetimonas hansenii JCM 7643]GBQ56538.1 hypothetical protein AA0243_1228 [Novacetimonas hansenii NRIC 0243]